MSVEVYVLASGSDGNCVVIEHEGRALMVDAGISYKRTKELMDKSGLDERSIEGILITHEHTDHIAGAGVISRKLDVPVICNDITFAASGISKAKYRQIYNMRTFEAAGMRVISLPTSHHAIDPNAYYFEADGRKILVATDTGMLTYPVEHALAEADLAIIESNYDKRMLEEGPYPPSLKRLIDSDIGHMSNVACAEAIKRTMSGHRRQIFLAHLSKHNNTPDIARETVANITGIRRLELDCMEFQGDSRVLRA